MSGVLVEDLPAGTIVTTRTVVFIRMLDGPGAVWHGTNGSRLHSNQIDQKLAFGAEVLRHGYGD